MKSKITLAFQKCKNENRPALITYIVGGDGGKKKSLEILKTLAKEADLCEIGFSFSTPIADGGEIQNCHHRTLKNGIRIKDIFDIVKKYNKIKDSKPIILMGYYQTIFHYGENKFIKKCKEVGVSGLIVVDLPFPENLPFAKKCKSNSICFLQLISPTTSTQRAKKIIQNSDEMNYLISMLSTTGGKLKVLPKKILENYIKIKKINPAKKLVIGFGITAKTIGSFKSSDGVVLGSPICKEITKSLELRQNPVTNLSKMVFNLKRKII